MSYNDKISVVIPSYNREKLIEKSVKSVLKQTYKNIEVIVVDDGSTDNTEEVLKKINDNRLIYIKLPENHGACYARNKGILKSTGRYIAFQDSDDVFCTDKLEKQLNNIIEKNSDLDFCKIRINDEDNIFEIPNDKQDNELDLDIITDFLCKGNFVSTQAIIAKREIFENILFDESLPRLQDYDLILRISSKYKISYTKEALVDLYRQDDNISKSTEKLKRACFIMMKKNYGFNNEQNYDLCETLLNYVMSTQIDKTDKKLEEMSKNYEELLDNYNKINQQYVSLKQELDRVLNSKGWKLLEKIRKLK